jgi:hypothetical protein
VGRGEVSIGRWSRMIKKDSPEPTVYRSLGLGALCETLHEGVTCDILELGSACGDSIEFWARYKPSIYIADLRSRMPLPYMAENPDDPETPKPDWERILDLPRDRCFDVILAWDLLNYLELPAAASLILYLCRFCRSGTVFFALMFDQKEMPEEITVYRIVDPGRLRYDCGSPATKACPRHQPRDLTRIMHQFRTSNSYRLQNGIVEYLYSYEGH